MVVANVGDSRVYLWRGGDLRQVSSDHSYVQELLTEGYITAAEARVHPRRNIVTRALGIEGDVNADSWVLPMMEGDRYLLCSDGLVDEVEDEQIATILRTTASPQQAAELLVTAANTNGGRDNVTVVVVDVVHDHAAEPTNQTESPTSSTRRRLLPALVAGVVAVVIIAISAVGWYARGGYFVGFDGDGDDATLVVFKGRSTQILWFAPTVHLDAGVRRGDLFPALVADIEENPTYESPRRAVAYVNSIRDVIVAERGNDGGGS
jgi:protein phosphatase